MPKTSLHSSRTSSTSSSSRAAATPKRRKKHRKPPVVDRMVVTAPVRVPSSSTAADGLAFSGLVSAPPAVTLPPVPNGFIGPDPADLLGFRALPAQIAAAEEAITELEGSTSYQATFGVAAPDVAQLAERLRIASQWTLLLVPAAAWLEYVKAQQGVAWKDALLLLDGLKKPFALACTADPALLFQYPATARLIEAKSVVARRSAAERARRKAAAKQATPGGGGDGA